MQPDSLLNPAAAPPLFAMEEWQSMEKAGTFTGERLFRQRNDAYRGIVQAVGSGMGIRATAKAFSVSTNTVYAVLEREGVAIDTIKQETLKQLTRAAAVGAERLADALESSPAKMGELAVALGIAIDKMQLLGGEPTARIEHRSVPSHEDINRFLEALPVAAATVSDGGKDGQQAAGPVGSGAGLELAAEGVDTAVTDSKSGKSAFEVSGDTGSATDRGVEVGAEGRHQGGQGPASDLASGCHPGPDQGVGGVPECTGGVFSHTGLPITEFCQGASSADAGTSGTNEGESHVAN